MRLKVFTLAYDADAQRFDDGELEAFVEDHEVLTVAEHFFLHEGAPVWALLVSYRERAEAPRPRREGGRAKPDWRADLDAAQGEAYDALRAWRNARAEQEGKPAYALFTNRQLAEVARRRPTTAAALGEVQGVGPSRVERYAEEVLAVLGAVPAADADP